MKKGWLFLLFLALPVFAQDAAKVWSGESELSFIKTTGNSVSDSLLAKQSLVYDLRPWRNTLKLEAANVSSQVIDPVTGVQDVVRTGERYYLTEQLDRFINERSYAFARGTHEKDRFNGFESQSTMVLGYGRTLVDAERFDMKAEVGLGRSSQEWDECDPVPIACSTDIPYGRTEDSTLRYLSETLVWKISNVAEFGQDLSVEDTADNRVSRLHAYLKSQLIGNLAMKLGFSLKHTDEVPDGKRHKDEEMTASLVYNF